MDGEKNGSGSKKQDLSLVLASLGTQAEGEGDSHFRLVLGLPYTITINIPCGYHNSELLPRKNIS